MLRSVKVQKLLDTVVKVLTEAVKKIYLFKKMYKNAQAGIGLIKRELKF